MMPTNSASAAFIFGAPLLQWIVGAVALATVCLLAVMLRDWHAAVERIAKSRSRTLALRFPARVRAFRAPTLLLWYFFRIVFVAPVLLVARVLGYNQSDVLMTIVRKTLNWDGGPMKKINEAVKARNKGALDALSGAVFVCTGGKSGTNLTMALTSLIAYKGDVETLFDMRPGTYSKDGVVLESDIGRHIHEVVPWPEEAKTGFSISWLDPVGRSPVTGLKVIKTGSCLSDCPNPPHSKRIAVVRDPKAIIVSIHKFMGSVALGPATPPLDFFVDLYVSSTLDDGGMLGWATRTASDWECAKRRDDCLVLLFEDTVADRAGTVKRVASFLGVDLTDAQEETIADFIDFRKMKRFEPAFSALALTPLAGEGVMLRSGKADGGHTALTEAQRRYIDSKMIEQLQRLGSDFPYRERYACW